MDEAKARAIILESLNAVLSKRLSALPPSEENFIETGLLDSLDAMNFLFELEKRLGHELDEIDDDFTEFTVKRISEILTANHA